VRWPKWRRADRPSDTDSVKEETPAAPVQAPIGRDGSDGTDVGPVVNEPDPDEQPTGASGGTRWSQAIAYALLPGLALLVASAAGYLKWQDASVRDAAVARAESVRAATDSTIALLSYKSETVEKDLQAARRRMTGQFLDSYTSLTHDVVIPGAKQKQISAVATVPAAASVRATENHAVVLLFVNQSVVIKQDAPTSTASIVRVTLDKVGGRWLISQFDPV
jgi:Mce-associated membrane protein